MANQTTLLHFYKSGNNFHRAWFWLHFQFQIHNPGILSCRTQSVTRCMVTRYVAKQIVGKTRGQLILKKLIQILDSLSLKSYVAGIQIRHLKSFFEVVFLLTKLVIQPNGNHIHGFKIYTEQFFGTYVMCIHVNGREKLSGFLSTSYLQDLFFLHRLTINLNWKR